MRARPQTKAAPTGRIPIKPPPAWIQQLGTPETDYATAVVVGPRDNVLVTGYYRPEGAVPDAWLAKYGPSRKLLWKVQLRSSGEDYSYDVAVDSKGYVYITGFTYGKVGDRYYGKGDAWVAKYSSAGKLQWKKQLGTTEQDASEGIATDSNGNVYLTGYTRGKFGNQKYGDIDAWFAKYDTTGKLQWKKQLGTTESDLASGVATDSGDNVYLTGETDGKLGDKKYGGPFDCDAWVAKYDSNGSLIWTKQLGTAEGDVSGGIATDSNGNVYLTGDTRGKLGDKEYGGVYDAWVAKYDTNGTWVWTRQLGTNDYDTSYGVATSSRGNVYITGYTYGKLGARKYGDSIDYDAWVAKYDSNGSLIWTKQLGTAEGDVSEDIATDSNGNVYLTGYTDGKLGDQQYGFTDAWVAKYKP
jgi:hypothetical protein